jgi:hypothetical protein
MERQPGTIPVGVDCAFAVDADWRHSGAVRSILGPPDSPGARSDDSSLIFAKVLNASDSHGLWIELNSEQKRFPTLPVLEFMIPWDVILGVAVDPDLKLAEEISHLHEVDSDVTTALRFRGTSPQAPSPEQ